MSDCLIIEGGIPLIGSVNIAGAKNAALKILAASILTSEPMEIGNLPHLQDITIMLELLGELGCKITILDQMRVRINSSHITNVTVPYDLIKAMRASIVVLGPLLARHGEAKVAFPGGCAIGLRPIDMHLDGLRTLGAEIDIADGFIHAKVPGGRLKGAHIHMHTVSVTGTENLLMAACLAEGTSVIHNAACEPEVCDLIKMLVEMGANIEGMGTATLTIHGVPELHGAEYSVMPDRIEAGTYLVAGAMTRGCVTVQNVDVASMSNILLKLSRAGAKLTEKQNSVTLDMQGRELKSINIKTAPYPGFPTDMQAQFMAMNTIASGMSEIVETIWENRFMHVPELQRLGANIRIKGNKAICIGVEKLHGAPVMASDLRASASLVLAGLAAEGQTTIEGLHHMDRGYEYLEEKFSRLGAKIYRKCG
jgi:UDP-N-acetylglucosamine 1-carboxyvinyltransferase